MIFGKTKLINELKKNLAEKESQLKASNDLMKDAQNELIQFQKKAAAAKSKLQDELDKKEAEIKDLKNSNEALKKAASKAESEIKSKAADTAKGALSEAKAGLESAESGSSALDSQIGSLEGKLKSLEEKLLSKEKEAASLVESLNLTKEKLASKEAEVESKNVAIKKLESLVAEKDSKLTDAKKKIEALIGEALPEESEDDSETYNVRFVADGKVISEVQMSSEDDSYKIPPIPEKEDFAAEWQYEQDGNDVTVTAVYVPIAYNLVFFVDDAKYCEMKASATDKIEVPPVPQKEDYVGEWEYTIIDGNEVRIDAMYRPIEYVAEFYADGQKVAERTLSVCSCEDIPEVPAKEDYAGEWIYEIEDEGKVRVDALYSPKVYDLMFFVDNDLIDEMKVSVGESITLPAVPAKEDYTGEWAYTVIDGNTARIDAMYFPKTYEAEFYADGKKIAERTLAPNIPNDVPEIPAKEDFDGEWQYENVSDGKIRVDAVYKPVEYDLIFFVDDNKYCELRSVSSEKIALPNVPPKEGYTGEWVYTVVDGTSARIDAFYTPIEEGCCSDSDEEEGILLTFYVDGKKCGEKLITSEEDIKNVPPVPKKEDYEGRWEYEQTGADTGDMVAVYTPIEYRMSFFVDGEKYAEAVMTAEDDKSVIPEVPSKPGYTGEWQYKKGDDNNVTVIAVYTAE